MDNQRKSMFILLANRRGLKIIFLKVLNNSKRLFRSVFLFYIYVINVSFVIADSNVRNL